MCQKHEVMTLAHAEFWPKTTISSPVIKTYCLLSGGRIDHGHHDGQAVRALNDAVAMAKACGKAMEMTNRGK